MSWKFTDLDEFKDEVGSIADSVALTQFNAASEQWQLGTLVPMTVMPNEALTSGWYKYQPQQRLYVAGEVSPATCESDPQEVDMRTGDPISVPIFASEIKYRVCNVNDCIQTLSESVNDKEFAAGVALGGMMFNEFWYGYPEVGTYGLFTHPLADVSVTPAPSVPVPGDTNFESKSANEIISEIRDAMKGMLSPNLAISEQAWNDVADKILGTGDTCNRAGDCILQKIAQSESTGTFQGTLNQDFFILKFLDDPEIGGVPSEGVYVVWDEGAVQYPVSDPDFLSPMAQKKRVDVIRGITTAGTIVLYKDSLKVVTGINTVQP